MCVYVDDVLVWGATRAQHDERLHGALELVKNVGLTFNAAKCKFAYREVEFLGNIIGQDGIKPNPTFSASIAETPCPTDKRAAQRMLGVANYFGKYSPHLTDKTKLLRGLIKKDTIFE